MPIGVLCKTRQTEFPPGSLVGQPEHLTQRSAHDQLARALGNVAGIKHRAVLIHYGLNSAEIRVRSKDNLDKRAWIIVRRMCCFLPRALLEAAHRPTAVITSGPRSESVALTSAALEPQLFASLDARHSVPSLGYVLEHPLKYSEVPELMCLDLFREFDFDVLAALAAPAKVHLNASDSTPITW